MEHRNVARVSRVIFMCGPAGAGKSTIARGLESDGMIRLSIDEAAWRLGCRTMPLEAGTQLAIEAALQTRLLELVRSGSDVVLDFSFWSLKMREEYRRLVKPLGVRPETIYVQTPREIALNRVRSRTTSHADDFKLSEDLATQYFDAFEPPTAEEGPLEVVVSPVDFR
ncbi:ATP-binding protein [Arthrobacter sp. 1P04PC]|uniref:AAA family ATPase n=1 Tax=unclassified Arthrobacter TaxID=235627 RepID=UPI0039A30836